MNVFRTHFGEMVGLIGLVGLIVIGLILVA